MDGRLLTLTLLLTTLCGCAARPMKADDASAPGTDLGCPTSTGSRLSSPGHCTGFGRSYSQADIQSTGKTTVGDALGQLDPDITVHH